jgi:hypothetical protein
VFPESAQCHCQSPSHSMPKNATTANACQHSHLGRSTARHCGLAELTVAMGGAYQLPQGSSAVTATTANRSVR